jgi:hypothetical protein
VGGGGNRKGRGEEEKAERREAEIRKGTSEEERKAREEKLAGGKEKHYVCYHWELKKISRSQDS